MFFLYSQINIFIRRIAAAGAACSFLSHLLYVDLATPIARAMSQILRFSAARASLISILKFQRCFRTQTAVSCGSRHAFGRKAIEGVFDYRSNLRRTFPKSDGHAGADADDLTFAISKNQRPCHTGIFALARHNIYQFAVIILDRLKLILLAICVRQNHTLPATGNDIVVKVKKTLVRFWAVVLNGPGVRAKGAFASFKNHKQYRCPAIVWRVPADYGLNRLEPAATGPQLADNGAFRKAGQPPPGRIDFVAIAGKQILAVPYALDAVVFFGNEAFGGVRLV